MSDDRYKDLEDLLYLGFIPHRARICGVDFVFKTVSELEYRKTSLMSGIAGDPLYNIKFHYNYLYHSVYMVNGVNILEKRDDIYEELITIFKSLPSVLIKKIFDILDKLSARLNKCSNLVEAYSYENISRYSWLSKKNTILNSYTHTGIRGTEALGLNQFQKYWQVLNLREDEKDAFEDNYGLAKFVASFTDPKSVKKMDAQDKAKKEEEVKRREMVKLIGSSEEERLVKYDPTASREGIVSELEKQMRGEKDDHDKAIEDHERRLRSNMLKQMQELKTMQESRRRSSENMDEARPISKEEMLERMNRSKSAPRVYMKSIDENESKYMEMSNVTTEDVLEESGLSVESYNSLVGDEVFGKIHKAIKGKDDLEVKDGSFLEDDAGIASSYVAEQRKLASKIGLDEDESVNFDFPNLRNR